MHRDWKLVRAQILNFWAPRDARTSKCCRETGMTEAPKADRVFPGPKDPATQKKGGPENPDYKGRQEKLWSTRRQKTTWG